MYSTLNNENNKRNIRPYLTHIKCHDLKGNIDSLSKIIFSNDMKYNRRN